MQKRGATQNAPGPPDGDEVFDQLVALNRRAFEIRRFNTAYHALMAALHWADDTHNEQELSLVERLAGEQMDWIDRYAPAYRHSTVSAGRRGNQSIFHNLERQASTILLRIRGERRFTWLVQNPLGGQAGEGG